MRPVFVRLNSDWNAEPNAPDVRVYVDGQDVILRFLVNSFQDSEFAEEDEGVLRFARCSRYRLGKTNDEGWYRGQCRFSAMAPEWGEFYAVLGDPNSTSGPNDWVIIQSNPELIRTHFLFYFRDLTFECAAKNCLIEPNRENALYNHHKTVSPF